MNDITRHAEALDYEDLMIWRDGATSAEYLEDRVCRGLDVDGHDYPMPDWLRRQLHFENLAHAIGEYYGHIFGELVCRYIGHRHIVTEDDARVSWYCPRCGDGGHAWW